MTQLEASDKPYAYLPEDLLLQMLKKSANVSEQLIALLDISLDQKENGRNILNNQGLIKTVNNPTITENLIAVDGANIIEKMTGSDLVMAIAVGVEGITKTPAQQWTQDCEQYYSWQAILPHHTANSRLTQGIMFLMELSILAKTDHTFRIMDGSHITSIMKLNSLLSAKDEDLADEKYVKALQDFLHETYEKIIPDIPDIIDSAFEKDSVIGMTKYSSSREILSSILNELEIAGDDKTFFSLVLDTDEYTKPLPVGQYKKERDQWNDVHIRCNLDLNISDEELHILKIRLQKSLERFRPGTSNQSQSNLYFLYYKPYKNNVCYRIELKKSLAEDQSRLELLLASIKAQIFFPEIQEPYPQYLADVIAKNIALGMNALKHAIRSNTYLSSNDNFNLLLSYRSN